MKASRTVSGRFRSWKKSSLVIRNSDKGRIQSIVVGKSAFRRCEFLGRVVRPNEGSRFRGTRRNFSPSNTQKPHIRSLAFVVWSRSVKLDFCALTQAPQNAFRGPDNSIRGNSRPFSPQAARAYLARSQPESTADQAWLAARLPAATPGTAGLRPGLL